MYARTCGSSLQATTLRQSTDILNPLSPRLDIPRSSTGGFPTIPSIIVITIIIIALIIPRLVPDRLAVLLLPRYLLRVIVIIISPIAIDTIAEPREIVDICHARRCLLAK